MNLQHLRYFVTVMETGSVSRAAATLGVAQPTLSVALKRLERELATPLFVAEGRGIRPLPQARKLEQLLRPIVRALADVKRELRDDTAPSLRVGIAQSLSEAWAGKLLGSCDGRVEIVEATVGELERLVSTGTVRIALTALPGKAKLPSKLLLREPYRLFVGAPHGFAGRRAVDLAELDGQPFVLRQCCEFLGSGRRLMEAAQVRLNIVSKTSQEATAATLVGAGVGCTIAPQSWQRPGLQALALTGFALERTVGLVWKAASDAAAAERIAKRLAATLGTQSGSPRAKR
jgi:DNA-binding transcriptional LysR family regulator